MLKIQYVCSSSIEGTTLPLLGDRPPYRHPQPRRRRLRLYIVGSQADTQNAVDTLHVLGYAERFEWSRAIAIPDGGITIQRDQGDILRYLQRDRLVE
ncbi:MAG: hypothetical protein ACFE0J_11915 [Elainellaceae cyanobacterium]